MNLELGDAGSRNGAFFVFRAALLPAAFALALCFMSAGLGPAAFGQGIEREDGSVPVPMDWSTKHVLFPPAPSRSRRRRCCASRESTLDGCCMVMRRKVQAWFAGSQSGQRGQGSKSKETGLFHWELAALLRMSPAKYTFDVNATPSCTADLQCSRLTRRLETAARKVAGTFTAAPTAGQTTAITITPTGGAAVTLTLTASAGSNTGLNFQTSGTVATDAANLAVGSIAILVVPRSIA